MKHLLKIENLKLKIKGSFRFALHHYRRLPRYAQKALATFLICTTVLTSGSMIYLFGPFTKPAEAAWFDENWTYREAIPATSTEGAAQTNVFLSFTLATDTLITNSKLQSNCQDIRITDAGGKLLKYHIGRVNACNNGATTIDFLLPSFPDGKSTYYVYYGNSVAPSADAGSLTVSAASASTVTASGNEITDVTRAAQVQGDGLYPSATNLVTNGGFETNTTGWASLNSATIARTTSDEKFGSAAIDISTTTGSQGARYLDTGTIPGAGEVWTASAYFKAKNIGDVGKTVVLYVLETGGIGSTTQTVVLTANWQRVTVTRTMVGGGTGFGVDLRSDVVQSVEFLCDGIQIEKNSAVATAYIETDGATASRFPDSSYGIWQAATNLITNGGFETDLTGWTFNNTAGTRITTDHKFGSASMNYTPLSQYSAVFNPPATTTALTTYTGSIWINRLSTSDSIVLYFLNQSDHTTISSTTVPAVTGWQRVTVTGAPKAGQTQAVISVQDNSASPADTFHLDGAQLETGSIATPYIETNGGTAARSNSRIQASASLINTTQSWIVFRMRMDWSSSSAPTQYPRIFEWRDDDNNRFFLGRYQDGSGNNNKWVIERHAGGSIDFATWSTTTQAIGDLVTVAAKWTATTVAISINGGAFVSTASTHIPTLAASTFYIGSSDANAWFINSDVLWATAGQGTLTDADATTINSYGNTDPTTTQLAALNSGIANSTFLWTADTSADTQTLISQGTARNYTIGALATEEKGPGPISYWSLDEGQGPIAKNSNWHKVGTTTNLITNPSFETATTSWSVSDFAGAPSPDGTLARSGQGQADTTPGLFGNYAMKATNSGSAQMYVTYQYNKGSALGSGSYSFSIYVLNGNMASPSSVQITDGIGQASAITNCPTTSTTLWTKCTVSYTFSSSASTTVNAYVYLNESGKYMYLDGAQLEAVSTVTPYCDGSLATQGSHQWSGTANASTSTCDYGTNADLYGATTWQTQDMCISGKCLYFDGTTSYASVANSGFDVSSAHNMTFSTWFRNTGNQGNSVRIFSTGSASWATGYWIGFGISSNVLKFQISDGVSTGVDVNGISSIRGDNKWHLVTALMNGNTAYLYLDGHLEASADISGEGAINASSAPHIGNSYNNEAASYFKGQIDEPKVYNYSRNANQILADFNSRGSSPAGGNVLGIKDQSYLSSGLVDYYKMDEASWNGTSGEVIDSSGNGNNGTATGSVDKPTTATGYFGNGGSFDGTDDYVNVSNATSINFSSDFSIAAWVKTNAVDSAYHVILQKGDSSDTCPNYQLLLSNNNQFRFAAEAGPSCSPSASAFSGTTALTNTWYHVVGVRQNGILKLYVNGALVNTAATAVTNDLTNTTPFTVGARRSSVGAFKDFWNGLIDESRLYNRALSPSEVSSLYNFAPGPVGYWNFDEGSGTIVNDVSGNANTGAWNGTPAWTQGKYSSAGNFTASSQYVNVGNNSTLSPASTITVEAWVYPTSLPNTDHVIVSRGYTAPGDATTSWWLEALNSGGNKWRLLILQSDLTTHAISGGTVTLNAWNHVVGVADGSNLRLYVNGVSVATPIAYNGTINTSTRNTLIGRTRTEDTYGNFFGRIDDTKIYNYARTAKQITEDMNGGHPAGGSPVGSMVGYWKMDEGYGGTANNSGNGGSALNGTINNMSSPATATSGWTNSGKFGKALNFDGTSDTNLNYISISEPATSPLNITGDVTVSAWIKPASGALDVSGGQIVRSGQFSDEVYGISYVPSLQRVDFDWYDGTFKGNSSTNNSIPVGQWSHIVAARTGSTLNIYINGVLNATSTVTTPTVAASDSFTIGGSTSPAVHQNFNGTIDEVKIYNYGLTTSDVAVDYNHNASQVLGAASTDSTGAIADNSAARAYCVPGDASTCNAPTAQWNFDENQGNNVNDISGNSVLGSWAGTLGSQWTQGKYGSAGNFNGTNNVVTAGTTNLIGTGTNPFTTSFWMRPTKTLTNGQWYFPIRLAQTSQLFVTFYMTGGTFYAYPVFRGSTQWATPITQSTLVNKWTHVTVTYNGGDKSTASSYAMYFNGVPIATGSVNLGGAGGSCNDNAIGSDADNSCVNNAGLFQGQIDEVRVYNYLRTPAQIAWEYNHGGPVGWWKLDECQGTVINDSSGQSSTGTLTVGALTAGTCTDGTGTTIWNKGASGKYNSSLYFDGTNDYVTGAIPAEGNSLTYSGWYKTSSSTNQNIVSSSQNNHQVGIYNSGKLTGGVKNGISVIDASTSNDGNWHHAVLTYDGTTVKLYRDGILVGSALSTNDGTGAIYYGIGTYGENTALYRFNGQLDDVKIYNYALTSTQIKTLYNSGAAFFGPVTGTP